MPHVDRWVVQTALAAFGRGVLQLPAGRSLCINLSGQTLGDAVVPRVRGRVPRPHRRVARPRLLRGHGELRDHQHRARAPLHRRAARHGLPVRARRLRPRPELVRQPQEPAARLPQDRRLLHPQPRRRHRQPGDGHRDDQAGALAQLPGDRRARRGPGRARTRRAAWASTSCRATRSVARSRCRWRAEAGTHSDRLWLARDHARRPARLSRQVLPRHRGRRGARSPRPASSTTASG